jgi:transposase
MAERLVNIDRQTPMLLPPDLREWVAENDLAHLVLEAVELCDMGGAQLNVRGSGSEQYPPSMMMALLIYAYCTGLFSSRRIERATYDSVALRYLCANHHPDHDTIAKFRRENEALFRKSFGQVLLMAREAGCCVWERYALMGRAWPERARPQQCALWKRSSGSWKRSAVSFWKKPKRPMPAIAMLKERNFPKNCVMGCNAKRSSWPLRR